MKKTAFSWVWLILAALLGGTITFLLRGAASGEPQKLIAPDAGKKPTAAIQCGYNVARVSGFQHVQPVLYSEPVCESERFSSMRNGIASLVEHLKVSGSVTSASVYVRDFKQGEWTWFNGDETYDPGSMLKISVLLTWLALIDEDPALLQRKWVCTTADAAVEQNTAFPSKQAQAGQSYSTAELLALMVVNSDNHATSTLFHHLQPERYFKTFSDLGLPVPDGDTKSYRMNVRDFSVFMKALFHSSYLSPVRSEYALELMTRSDFNRGLVAGIPEGIDIAHKFGEAGDPAEKQLHETGLIYLDEYPYLITVMTRGQQVDSLANAVGRISRLVYEHMRPS